MSDTRERPRPVLRRAAAVEYESVDAAAGLRKGVLLDDEDGAPTFAMRRFTLAPGSSVPRHTNEVEHEQYVLAGEYVVGLKGSPTVDGAETDDLAPDEYRVRAGDAILVPPGTVHWYRNDGDEEAAFVCVVPNGDDSIDLVE